MQIVLERFWRGARDFSDDMIQLGIEKWKLLKLGLSWDGIEVVG